MKARWLMTLMLAGSMPLVACGTDDSSAAGDSADQAHSASSQASQQQAGLSESGRVAAGQPGALLSVQPQAPAEAMANAARRYLITYRSRGVHGEPVVVSGYIVIPKGEPPKSGWPVMAWAHGTTGVADICAPSGIYPGGPEYGYQKLMNAALDPWLARGYAVVATDYQGLGTPGMHPYMNATSAFHSVVDSVRAAHHLLPKKLSPEWLVMGHSQGGASALAVAANANAPDLHLRGAIALAPGGYALGHTVQYVLKHQPVPKGIVTFLPLLFLGAGAADSSIHPYKIVSNGMAQWLDLARSRCLSGLRTIIKDKQPPKRIFKKNANLGALQDYLAKQSIKGMVPTVPILLVQGTKDRSVNPAGTQAYYKQMCEAGKIAFYYPVQDGNHRDSLRYSVKPTAAFLAYLNSHDQSHDKMTSCNSG